MRWDPKAALLVATFAFSLSVFAVSCWYRQFPLNVVASWPVIASVVFMVREAGRR